MAKKLTIEHLLKEAQVLKIDTTGLDTINKVADAISAHKKAEQSAKLKKKVSITILNSVAGRYRLSANIGDTISIDEDQAEEMINNGDAKKA